MGDANRRNRPRKSRSWREWFESHPLFLVLSIGTTACVGTLAVANYYFAREREITAKASALELEQTRSELATRCKELETRLSSIRRDAGATSYWDVSKMLVKPSDAATIGSEYAALPGMEGCYLAEPGNGAWERQQMSETEFEVAMYGSWWKTYLDQQPLAKEIRDVPVLVWRGPGGFEISTVAGTYHAFPSVRIRIVDKEMLLALFQRAATTEPAAGDDPELTQQVVDVFQNSDLPGIFFAQYVFGGYVCVAFVKGGTFTVLNADKKEKVFYIRAQSTLPPTDKSPLVFVDTEIVCIERKKDLVIIETAAVSRDRRPIEAAWISNWLASLRVLSE